MQRKSTPLSHPFHVLFRRILAIAVLGCAGVLVRAETPLFHIECPADVTVDCTAELWDLSMYGNAIVYGYSGPESAGPPISTEYNLNSCDVGTIVRTWVAYDYSGDPFYCSQTIYVTGSGGAVDIHWPPDYIIHACNPQTDPEDLPSPYDHPVIYGGGSCTQLLTNHEDLVFDINPPACRKILRKWTIIDWCEYDPNSWDPSGIWQYTQIIKITPEHPPTLTCPADTIVSAGADCSGGYVQLPLAYGSSDCGSGVIITNYSPYAFSHGADASGNYPLGTTKVTFKADDGCGQTTTCNMYVTVKDLKKPTPICYYGVTVALMQMPDGFYMDLRPGFFDKGSFDNCTPKDKLKMWVDPPRVGCEDIGAREVRLYVEDESGNVQYCNTLVYVQDNMGMCPPSDGVIDGAIHSRSGDVLEEVKVSLSGTPTFDMTDETGFYAFTSVPFGQSYSVMPERDHDELTGVSALDMAILLKHILGVQRFTTPYQYIAGDIDRSGRVSVNDLVLLKDLIIQNHLGLQATTSWRFVDATYLFPDPLDPLTGGFPESYAIAALSSDMSALDFVGIKLGDLNDDAAHLVSGNGVLSRSAGVMLSMAEHLFTGDEIFDVAISIEQYAEIDAMEFALTYDDLVLELIRVQPLMQHPGLDIIDQTSESPVISTLWYGIEPLEKSHLFQLTFRARKAGALSEAVALTPGSRSLAYLYGSDQPAHLALSFGGVPETVIPATVVTPAMRVGNNAPNPFGRTTVIPVELPEDGPLLVHLYDMDGRHILTRKYAGVAGWQEITLDASDIQVAGVVMCRIVSSFGNVTQRMLVHPTSY